jgi:hypothetical protein
MAGLARPALSSQSAATITSLLASFDKQLEASSSERQTLGTAFQYELAAGWHALLNRIAVARRAAAQAALDQAEAAVSAARRSFIEAASVFVAWGSASDAPPQAAGPLSPEQLRSALAKTGLRALSTAHGARALVGALGPARAAESAVRAAISQAAGVAGALQAGPRAQEWGAEASAWALAEQGAHEAVKSLASEVRRQLRSLREITDAMERVGRRAVYGEATVLLERRKVGVHSLLVHTAETMASLAVPSLPDEHVHLLGAPLQAGLEKVGEVLKALAGPETPKPAAAPLLDADRWAPAVLTEHVRGPRPPAQDLAARSVWLRQLVASLQAGRRELVAEAARLAAGWDYAQAEVLFGVSARTTVQLIGKDLIDNLAAESVEGARIAAMSWQQRMDNVRSAAARLIARCDPLAAPANPVDSGSPSGCDTLQLSSSGTMSEPIADSVRDEAAHGTRALLAELAELDRLRVESLLLMEQNADAVSVLAVECGGNAAGAAVEVCHSLLDHVRRRSWQFAARRLG